MKQIIISALVAAVVSGIVVLSLAGRPGPEATTGAAVSPPVPVAAPVNSEPAGSGLTLSLTDALPEDVWLDGSRQSGDDHRILTRSDTSVCFITKVDVRGISSPDDAYSCSMEVDDFTGFWDLVVRVDEGSQANVRCNARCLTWE